MVMHLIDSSIWVRSLRGDLGTADRVKALLAAGEVATCEPVVMELLVGASVANVARLEALLDSLPSLRLDPDLDFCAAAAVMRAVRSSGNTVRSSLDGLVAAIAQRHDAVVVHDDVDFVRIAMVSPLVQERWSA